MIRIIYKFIFWGIFMLMGWFAQAQQDPMFTQYNKNPLSINPAIAGMYDSNNLTLLLRSQWVGMEGAPKTSTITYQNKLNNNMGLGASFIYDRIGPIIQTGIYADYAYHLTLDKEKFRNLSLGLMMGVNHYSFDLISLQVNEFDDDIPVDGRYTLWLPNFGVGAFYYAPKFFFGISVPKLLRNSLTDVDNTLTLESREERHLFAMTGSLLELNPYFKFRPSAIGRMVNGAPVSLDLNASLIYNDKISFGALYRVGVSIGGIAGWQLSDKLYLSYSYDFFNRKLGRYSFGTHEIVLSYDFKKKTERVISPRYF
jgi:type IX secretion system PorP/SprF family membrane protein